MGSQATTIIAICGPLAAALFLAAWLVARRARRITGLPEHRPADLVRGQVAEGTLVQLRGRASGQAQTAPWSRREVVAWTHVLGLAYKEEDTQGQPREVGSLLDKRHPPALAWAIADPLASVPVRGLERLPGDWEHLPVAASWRWPVEPGRRPERWEVHGVPVEPAPSWHWPPHGWGCEVTATERVIAAGQPLVAIGRVRREGGQWTLALDEHDGAITVTGAGQLVRRHRFATRLLLVLGLVVVGAGAALVVVGKDREAPCPAVIAPELSGLSPSLSCCVDAQARTTDHLRFAPARRGALSLSPRGEPWAIAVADGPWAPVGVAMIEPGGAPVEVHVRRQDDRPLGRYCLLLEPR